jgi:predicted N-acetyltransferase YhbS
MVAILTIARLAFSHDVSTFDCGQEDLNGSIRIHALTGQRANISQTYVAVDGNVVVGYHTLVVGDIVCEGAPERLAKGIPRYPIQVLLLARLSVAIYWQGKGLGAAIVVCVMWRTQQVTYISGVRAMVVHANNNATRNFYTYFGFEPFPREPFVLYRLLKDLKAMQKEG